MTVDALHVFAAIGLVVALVWAWKAGRILIGCLLILLGLTIMRIFGPRERLARRHISSWRRIV